MLRSSPDPYRGSRELHVYQSGFLNNLPGDITAPRFLGSIEEPGEASCLWLEDIADEADKPWSLAHFGLVARRFGQLNSAYLTGQALPEHPWVSRRWLRGSVARRTDTLAELATILDDPLIRKLYPGDTAERTFRLWAERETFLDAIERLPQTFCHLDVFPRNVFARHAQNGRAHTVAIDWAFAGIAALGEEIVPLIWGSMGFGEVGQAKLPELEAVVFDSYLDGLHDGGWQGSPQDVQLGYALAAPLRYGFPRDVKAMVDKNNHAAIEQAFGRPIGELFEAWGNLQPALLQLADEARESLNSLG